MEVKKQIIASFDSKVFSIFFSKDIYTWKGEPKNDHIFTKMNGQLTKAVVLSHLVEEVEDAEVGNKDEVVGAWRLGSDAVQFGLVDPSKNS